MKKSLIVLATLVTASSVFAGEFTGRIITLNQDDEGMKVIMQQSKESSSPVLLYLDNKSKDFTQTIENLKAAKENADKVKITVTNDKLTQITKIQFLDQ